MIGELKEYLSKLNVLERQIEELNLIAQEFERKKYILKRVDFLNYSCLEKESFKIAHIKIAKDNHLLIECSIEIFCASEQDVEICLMIGDVMIQKINKKLGIGMNNVSISQEYLSFVDQDADICVDINPTEEKEIVLQGCNLKIWGIDSVVKKEKYDVVDCGENLFIGILDDEKIYYKIITKQAAKLNKIDLDFFAKAKSFCLGYFKKNEKVFLFRVDLDGNLFIDNLLEGDSLFVDSEVIDVSCAASDEKIVAAYIKNGLCKSIEIETDNLVNISDIDYNYINNECAVFYNNYSDKFFIVLKNLHGENIMLEMVKETFAGGENLGAVYDIFIETYEVTDEV